MVDISIDRKVGGVVSYLHCVICLYFWQTSANSLYSFSVDHSLAWSTVGRAWRDDRMLDHTSNRPSTINSIFSGSMVNKIIRQPSQTTSGFPSGQQIRLPYLTQIFCKIFLFSKFLS